MQLGPQFAADLAEEIAFCAAGGDGFIPLPLEGLGCGDIDIGQEEKACVRLDHQTLKTRRAVRRGQPHEGLGAGEIGRRSGGLKREGARQGRADADAGAHQRHRRAKAHNDQIPIGLKICGEEQAQSLAIKH